MNGGPELPVSGTPERLYHMSADEKRRRIARSEGNNGDQRPGGTKRMVADALTVGRMLFSLFLLVFSPFSPLFGILYLLCGITDVLDGFAARRLHTESKKGARLDSAADLFFAVVYAVRILPRLSVPLWIWIWTTVIAAGKLTVIVSASMKAHSLRVEHSIGNKLTGVLLFLLPLSVCTVDVRYGAAAVCTSATITAVMEIVHLRGGTETAE